MYKIVDQHGKTLSEHNSEREARFALFDLSTDDMKHDRKNSYRILGPWEQLTEELGLQRLNKAI